MKRLFKRFYSHIKALGPVAILITIGTFIVTVAIAFTRLEPEIRLLLAAGALITALQVAVWWFFATRQRPLEAYRDLGEAPARYRFREFRFLERLGRDDHLTIFARTAKTWLVGHDDDDNSGEQRRGSSRVNMSTTREKQQKLKDAIRAGATIDFILQDLRSELPGLAGQQGELKADQLQAIESLKDIVTDLPLKQQGNLRYWYTSVPVTNSITAHRVGGRFKHLIYVLDMSFGKKAVVIINEEDIANDIFAKIPPQDELLTEEQYQLDLGKAELHALLEKHGGYAKKNNSPRQLLKHSARWFEYNNNDPKPDIPPPVSVQLLLTNKCVNRCTMCTHFQLGHGSPRKEMHLEEIKRVLQMISSLGTNSLIISGGEPLLLTELADILQYAKGIGDYEENGLKMNIGFLTSGVGKNGQAIDKRLAEILCDSCSWIQVSIDSFDRKRYENIRQTSPGQDHGGQAKSSSMLDEALKTIRRIVRMGHKNVDICYTIQKSNIHELISGEVFRNISDMVPRGVNVRFKPVHGTPVEVTDAQTKDFRPTAAEFRDAISSMVEHQWEDDYLEKTLRERIFSYEDLSCGMPTKTKLVEFIREGYTCHALQQTLFIDSNGNVYPCCYLFDDNVGQSRHRAKYLLGSLRDDQTGQVPDPYSPEENPLLEIWRGDKLRELRETPLPIEEDACSKCTRHVRHNQCANEITRVFEKYKSYGPGLASVVPGFWPPADGAWV